MNELVQQFKLKYLEQYLPNAFIFLQLGDLIGCVKVKELNIQEMRQETPQEQVVMSKFIEQV